MSDISVIGLGSMGSALARAVQTAGHRLTVWNRTAEKVRPFVNEGATGAASAASALEASPVTVVCIDNYAVTRRILETDDTMRHLSGKTLIQLTTGTPREARDFEEWLRNGGVDYIDGAITDGPAGVDAGTAQILFAGAESTFRRHEKLLQCLGGDLRYVGENIGAAAALDLAWLSQRYGLFVGVAHGARLCESENVGLDLYASMFPEGDRARTLTNVMHADAYEKPGATLAVWAAALKRVQSQAEDAGINREIPDFVADLLGRAMAEGYGEEDVAALLKVLREARAINSG